MFIVVFPPKFSVLLHGYIYHPFVIDDELFLPCPAIKDLKFY